MPVESMVVSPFATNCFIFSCGETSHAAVIDPGDQGDEIAKAVQDAGLTLTHVLLTHGHVDHVSGLDALCDATGAKVYMHRDDLFLFEVNPGFAAALGWVIPPLRTEPDAFLEAGQTVTVGEQQLDVLHTPGHSPGSICFKGSEGVFCGDLVFAGGVGRTDLPGGSGKTLLQSIRDQILTLPDETPLFSGHGPSTTVGTERRSNPFLQDGGLFL